MFKLRSAAFLLVLSCCWMDRALAQEPGELRFPDQGFSIQVDPDKWIGGTPKKIEKGTRVDVGRKDGGGLVGATILQQVHGSPIDAPEALRLLLQGLEGRAEYQGHELLPEQQIAGLAAACSDIRWKIEGIDPLRIRQHVISHGTSTYAIQAHAPLADWDKHEADLQRVVSSFTLIEANEDDLAAQQLQAQSDRCGSELDWAPDWETAAQRATAEGKHVLAVVHSYPGFDLPDSTRFDTFMDEDVVALVREHLVPVRLSAKTPSPVLDPEVYGMGPSTFGAAMLLIRADGNVLADTPHTKPILFLPWLWRWLESVPSESVQAATELPHMLVEPLVLLGRFEAFEAATRQSGEAQEPPFRAQTALLRARVLRFQHKPAEALLQLAEARELDPELDPVVTLLEAEQHWNLGNAEAARAALRGLLEDPSSPEHPKALYLQSWFIHHSEGVAAARPLRETLVRDFPESRWSWLAATFLLHEALLESTGPDEQLRLPRPEVLAELTEPAAAPGVPGEGAQAAEEALAWLRAHQRASGSWPSKTDLHRPDDKAPDPVATAITSVGVRALLRRGADHRDAAVEGLRFLLATDRIRREAPDPIVYMDYTAWASWAQLELLADALEQELHDAGELRAFGQRLVDDLTDRVRSNGGWSYYISGSADGSGGVEQSISFTTAAAVFGLIRARGAGIEVPEPLVENALDCLEALRDDEGFFGYMLMHPSGQVTRSAAPGSAGRGPACELALFMGGRSNIERLTQSMALFEAHGAAALDGEVGKALMHAGADSQGCHYPFFDYLMAAKVLEHLPKAEAGRYRTLLEELVLAGRLADGSFQDTPIIGRSFGTAAALLTLSLLGI